MKVLTSTVLLVALVSLAFVPAASASTGTASETCAGTWFISDGDVRVCADATGESGCHVAVERDTIWGTWRTCVV